MASRAASRWSARCWMGRTSPDRRGRSPSRSAAAGIAQPLPHDLEWLAKPARPPIGDHAQTTRARHDHPQAPQGQAHDHRLAQVAKALGNFGTPLTQSGRARHDGFSGNQAISLSRLFYRNLMSRLLFAEEHTLARIHRSRIRVPRNLHARAGKATHGSDSQAALVSFSYLVCSCASVSA